MSLFSKLFRRKNKEEEGNFSNFVDDLIKTGKELQDARINELQERHDAAAGQGKLPAPDIAAKYDCECGSKNTFHIKNLNLEGGLNVQCAHCGAVLHVPPTILDHSEYWSAGGGASLVPNWRDQMKFVKHGKQSSSTDSNKIEDSRIADSQAGEQNECTENSFSTWRTIKLGTFQNVGALKKALTSLDFRISEWAYEAMDNPAFSLASKETEVELVVASVKDLGFTSNTRYDELCAHIKKLGYALCPAEVGPQLWLQYPDQASGEPWTVIAMEPISDSEGDLEVFQVTPDRKGCELRMFPSRWHGNPNFVSHPDGRLVFFRHK